MSKEAVDQFNTKIGSNGYWVRLNRGTLLGRLMDSKTNYQATLRTLGEKASKTIDEIYADLSTLGTQIRFLPSSDRNTLANQVEDKYNFDNIRSISGNVESIVKFNPGLGNLANDAGLLSQADGVISVYYISVAFEKTVELRGVFR